MALFHFKPKENRKPFTDLSNGNNNQNVLNQVPFHCDDFLDPKEPSSKKVKVAMVVKILPDAHDESTFGGGKHCSECQVLKTSQNCGSYFHKQSKKYMWKTHCTSCRKVIRNDNKQRAAEDKAKKGRGEAALYDANNAKAQKAAAEAKANHKCPGHLQNGCPHNAEAGESRGKFCLNCKIKEKAHNSKVSNKRMTNPEERVKYKAQLAAWRLLNPRTRAATLFFGLHEEADVSPVEVWLRENKLEVVTAIQGLDEVTGMDFEDLLTNWLGMEIDLVFFDVEKLLGGKHVSDLDRLLQLGMTLGDSSLNLIQANKDIYQIANTGHSGVPIDSTRQRANNSILEKVSGTVCDKAKTSLFFQNGIKAEVMVAKILAFIPQGATVITKARCGLDERTLDALFGSSLINPCADYSSLLNIKSIRPDVTILNLSTYFCRIFNGFPSFRLDYLVSSCETLDNFRFHDAVQDCLALRALLGLVSDILYHEDVEE